MRWLDESHRIRGPHSTMKRPFLKAKNTGPMFLGGSEGRTCGYCKIPRLLTHCEEESHALGSPFKFEISREFNMSFVHLPLALSSETWHCKGIGPGQWLPFQNICTHKACQSDKGLFSGDAKVLSPANKKRETMLPLQLQPSQWFFQPAQDRYHLYSRIELFQCLSNSSLIVDPYWSWVTRRRARFSGPLPMLQVKRGSTKHFFSNLNTS